MIKSSSGDNVTTRFRSLDGWRGVSIILVLLGHFFPLGPKIFQLNAAVAASGMAIFFILSGFLITNFLMDKPHIREFLIKRFFRIFPLAWFVIWVCVIYIRPEKEFYFANFLFYANLPPYLLLNGLGHFWSLCVEVQFYGLIAVLYYIFGKKTFVLLPLICLAVTINRIFHGVEISINTIYRIDEILAGSSLAYINAYKPKMKALISRASYLWLFPLLIASSHPGSGILSYCRPYIAMLLLGSTLFGKNNNEKWLDHTSLMYIANISYALYVLHGALNATWLGQGDALTKYAKRIPLLIVTFSLAHISTFYFEKRWIEFGKKLAISG